MQVAGNLPAQRAAAAARELPRNRRARETDWKEARGRPVQDAGQVKDQHTTRANEGNNSWHGLGSGADYKRLRDMGQNSNTKDARGRARKRFENLNEKKSPRPPTKAAAEQHPKPLPNHMPQLREESRYRWREWRVGHRQDCPRSGITERTRGMTKEAKIQPAKRFQLQKTIGAVRACLEGKGASSKKPGVDHQSPQACQSKEGGDGQVMTSA